MCTGTHYDVIIVGSGAGGATLAHRLAPTGKRILVLERGDWLPREAENWSSQEVFGRHRYHTKESWRDVAGKSFTPATLYKVGGNTKIYGATLLRRRERDFVETVHEDGVAPAWPLSYADFAPYYLEAERLYQVHGERGADPTEPPETAPYPHPALAHEPLIAELADNLRRIGCAPFPLPMALHVDAANPRLSPCIRCTTCDGFPCLLHAKADAEITCMRPALASGNVELLTQAYVERLDTSASGREVTTLQVRHGKESLSLTANIVVVACGAINSAALLLRSRSARHPHGLANGSDAVGRHYMCHNNSGFIALTAPRNPTRFQKTLGLNDFYHGRDGDPPLGHIQMLGKADGATLGAQLPPGVPTTLLDAIGRHTIDFWLMSEDLPKPDNRVEIDSDGTIRLSYRPNNVAAHRKLDARLRDVLSRAQRQKYFLPDRAYFSMRIPLAGVAHQCGTVRFGRDPKSSALDVNCRAHEVDNLYVVDGSFVPASAAVNPTLTIIANALRVGDVIRERLE